jgi:hypothetical protein
MNETEVLVGFAELSVGLAGFAGIVTALRRGTSWHPADAHRLWILLSLSLGCAANALVVAGISLAAVNSDVPWRCGSAMHVVAGIAWIPFLIRHSRGLQEHRAIVLRPIFIVVGSVFGATVLLAQTANAVGWPYRPSSAVYFLALLFPLGLSALAFAELLLLRPDTE